MTVYDYSLPVGAGPVRAEAMYLQDGFATFLRHATLTRLARIEHMMQGHKLRTALSHWHRSSQFVGWMQRRDHSGKKADEGHVAMASDHKREVAELRRRWRDEREAAVKAVGYSHESGGVVVHADDVQHLKGIDKKYQEQLAELREGHSEHKERFKSSCQKSHDECNTNLKTMVLLGTDPTSKAPRQLLAWRKDDIDAGALEWSFTQRPEAWMVPFPQAVVMEEHRQPLVTTAQLLLECMDKLPAWARLAAARPGKARTHLSSPLPGARLMKSVLRRAEERVMRSAMSNLRSLPRRVPRFPRASTIEDAPLDFHGPLRFPRTSLVGHTHRHVPRRGSLGGGGSPRSMASMRAADDLGDSCVQGDSPHTQMSLPIERLPSVPTYQKDPMNKLVDLQGPSEIESARSSLGVGSESGARPLRVLDESPPPLPPQTYPEGSFTTRPLARQATALVGAAARADNGDRPLSQPTPVVTKASSLPVGTTGPMPALFVLGEDVSPFFRNRKSSGSDFFPIDSVRRHGDAVDSTTPLSHRVSEASPRRLACVPAVAGWRSDSDATAPPISYQTDQVRSCSAMGVGPDSLPDSASAQHPNGRIGLIEEQIRTLTERVIAREAARDIQQREITNIVSQSLHDSSPRSSRASPRAGAPTPAANLRQRSRTSSSATGEAAVASIDLPGASSAADLSHSQGGAREASPAHSSHSRGISTPRDSEAIVHTASSIRSGGAAVVPLLALEPRASSPRSNPPLSVGSRGTSRQASPRPALPLPPLIREAESSIQSTPLSSARSRTTPRSSLGDQLPRPEHFGMRGASGRTGVYLSDESGQQLPPGPHRVGVHMAEVAALPPTGASSPRSASWLPEHQTTSDEVSPKESPWMTPDFAGVVDDKKVQRNSTPAIHSLVSPAASSWSDSLNPHPRRAVMLPDESDTQPPGRQAIYVSEMAALPPPQPPEHEAGLTEATTQNTINDSYVSPLHSSRSREQALGSHPLSASGTSSMVSGGQVHVSGPSVLSSATSAIPSTSNSGHQAILQTGPTMSAGMLADGSGSSMDASSLSSAASDTE